jgi:hypothetical protein
LQTERGRFVLRHARDYEVLPSLPIRQFLQEGLSGSPDPD